MLKASVINGDPEAAKEPCNASLAGLPRLAGPLTLISPPARLPQPLAPEMSKVSV